MFQMTVEDAVKIHKNLISIAGPCLNRKEFTNRLVDNYGNVYDAHIPFDKTIVFDETRIMLGIFGKYEADFFRGLTLRNA